MEGKEHKKGNRSLHFKVAVLCVELLLMVVLIGAIYVYRIYEDTISKLTYTGEITETEAGINEMSEAVEEEMEGYTNIALFGLDNRSSGDLTSGNSDTIMIASINNETGEIRLVSLYRDTYLNIGGGRYQKANAAYAYGGPTQAVAMLNSNLDLDITEYVSVDWLAVVEAVDALGGLDLEITDKEVSQINKYMGEVEKMTGTDSTSVTESGLVHLDGVQACTYARIRKTSGDDFLRTSRQRIVLQAMLEKAKTSNLATLQKVASEIFDDITTSLTEKEILNLVKHVGRYELKSTTGFPFDVYCMDVHGYDAVVPIDLAQNVTELHQWLFSGEAYSPSETVQEISSTISEKSGIYAGTATNYDTSLYNETVGANGTEETKSNNTAAESGSEQ